MAYRIRPSRPPAREIRRIAREQLKRALASLDAAERDPDLAPDRVHDVRVRCKRLRALLRLVRRGMGDSFDAEDARLRAAADALAGARDAQVALDTFDAVVGDLRDDPRVRGIRATLDARRDLEAVARAEPGDATARALLETSLGALDAWAIDHLHADDLWDAYRETYRKARRHLRNALADPAPANAHAWRRWAKRHWYQVRLMRSANPKALRKRAAALDRLTERLGDRHDLDVLVATLNSVRPAPDPDALALVLDRVEKRTAGLMFRAFRDGVRLFSDPPSRASSALEKSWSRRRPPGRPG